jgi:hypothetical protein
MIAISVSKLGDSLIMVDEWSVERLSQLDESNALQRRDEVQMTQIDCPASLFSLLRISSLRGRAAVMRRCGEGRPA